MNRTEFKTRFPNASKSTIEANLTCGTRVTAARTRRPSNNRRAREVGSRAGGINQTEGKVKRKGQAKFVCLIHHKTYTKHCPDCEREAHENHPNPQIQDTEPQRHKAPALGAAVQGKAESLDRIRVCFIGYRTRPLDPDNFAAGTKDLLDGLRHAALIHGDEPWRIDFQTRQVKVAHRKEERTVIEIVFPD
jgi:hypothetical protein